MSRILKRPMFKRGGQSNDGIMSNVVDREQYSKGTDRFGSMTEDEIRSNIGLLTGLQDRFAPLPKTRLPIGEVGFALASGVDPIDALGLGYKKFVSDDDKIRAIRDKRKSAAVSTVLGQAIKPVKDVRTEKQKNLEAAGFPPGSPEYEAAMRKSIFPEKDLRTTAKKNADDFGLTGDKRDAYIKAATIRTEALGGEFATKANIDAALKAGNYAVESMDFMIDVAKLGVRSPDAFGFKGKFLGIGKDVATELEGIFDSSLRSAADGGIEAGVYDMIRNPDFSKIQPLENAMSIRLARTRNPQDRLMKDMIRDAKQDTELTGLGGAAKIRDRLPVIFREFLDTARNRLKSAGKTDEEIAAALNPKIQEFNTLMSQLAGVTAVDDKPVKLGKGKKRKFKLEFIDGVYRKIPLE